MSISLYLRARILVLRHPVKAVLKELAFMANDQGTEIYPSVATIARFVGLSERAVQKALRELERAMIAVPMNANRGGAHGRTNAYALDLTKLPPLSTGVNGVHPSDLHTGERDAPRVNSKRPRVNESAATGEQRAPNRLERPERPEKDGEQLPPMSRAEAELWTEDHYVWRDFCRAMEKAAHANVGANGGIYRAMVLRIAQATGVPTRVALALECGEVRE